MLFLVGDGEGFRAGCCLALVSYWRLVAVFNTLPQLSVSRIRIRMSAASSPGCGLGVVGLSTYRCAEVHKTEHGNNSDTGLGILNFTVVALCEHFSSYGYQLQSLPYCNPGLAHTNQHMQSLCL